MALPSIHRLDRITDEVLGGFRAALSAARFSGALLDELETLAPDAPGPVRLQLVRAQLRLRTAPCWRVVLLLGYAGVLERSEADRVLGASVVAGLRDAGILDFSGGRVRSPFRFQPLESCWVMADDIIDQPDSVMPPGPTTEIVAHLLPQQLPGSALDVGCGPGSLALVAAARGATRVLGTDINPRAIAMAKFNARLNRSVAEFRVGDLLDPAGGERFDLLVAQPSFIMRPPGVAEITFLHGGPRGDELFRRLMRGASGSLTPAGEALVLCDVTLRKGEDVAAYLRDELGPTGLDLMALHLPAHSLDTHALIYAKHGSSDDGEGYVREIQQYRAHLDALGITSLRQALFLARRPRGDRDATTTPIGVREFVSATAPVRARLWAAVDGSAESDAALMGRRVRVAPRAEWMSLRDAPEGEQKEHRVRFGSGWPALEQIVTDEGVMLAALLERSATVEGAIAAYAELCDAGPDDVRASLLSYIRQSLLTGMLVFEENGRGS